jgi:hypothetical protein
MIETQKFEHSLGKFENLEINIHHVMLDKFAAIPNSSAPDQSPYTGVWEALNWYYYVPNDLQSAGDITIQMRNQNFEDDTILFMVFRIDAKAINETDKASIFAKEVQYLFEWVNEKVDNGEITDMKGRKFIVPAYGYSSSHFEAHFQNFWKAVDQQD